MYSGWISDRISIEDDCGCYSVLDSFPDQVGRSVTSSVVRSLLVREKTDFFKNEKDVDWTMDVICYGLNMPLTELEMIKNCVFIYRDWTSVVSEKPNPGIPRQIVDNKEFYFNKMLKQLTNLFRPRESNSTVLQATLCSQVLTHIRNIVQERNLGKRTCESILHFYLGISGHLLSVPPFPGGLAEQLCERLINCLLNVWLHISSYHFPTPTLWSTLQEMVSSWRHHEVLVSQWNNVTYVLTCKVLTVLFGPHFLLVTPNDYHTQNSKDDGRSFSLPINLTNELAVQCWFRFLHLIGNPVSLSKKEEVSGTRFFNQYSLEHDRMRDSHASLKSLPSSFYKAMRGIAILVSMFLGNSLKADPRRFSQSFSRGDRKFASTGGMENMPKFPGDRSAKSVPGVRKFPDRITGVRDDSNLKIANAVPSVTSADTNCIMHLFGSWLFDVCFSGIHVEQVLQTVGLISCGLKPKSLQLTKEDREQFGTFPPVKKNEFEPGRAEGFSTLCKIFCHHTTTGQAILPVYLSRFYLSMAVGLCYYETRSAQVLCSILFTATNILKIDLQGVQVLVPHILQAIEIILPTPTQELVLGYDVALVELRRSCIQLLLSMLCLPLHFLQLNIQGLCREKISHTSEGGNGYIPNITFLSLKERLTRLLMQAIDIEEDSLNTQMLLGGAMLMMEDTMCVESKNYEFSKLPPGAMPCINLNDGVKNAKESPKLIHIAKQPTARPTAHIDMNKRKPRTAVSKADIGVLGEREDILCTKGQFVSMTGLLCQKLMFDKWRLDLHVTLSALECFSGMAQLDAKFVDEEAAKKALKWTCDYIEYQAKQPPPSHSKDLHSIIIAAFSCIALWLVNHPWLVDDQHCLTALLEVIELGISGSKSKPHAYGELPTLKGDKELKPVSFRVRESAEALLALMMEHMGFFPTPCGPSSISSVLDETKLLENSKNPENTKFYYYALDGNVILALHEESLKGLTDNLPTITSILRGPDGKRVCLIELRHFPRDKQHLAELHKLQPERPLGMTCTTEPPNISQQNYPSDVERVNKVKADMSLPEITSILDETQETNLEHMKLIMAAQKEEEEVAQLERKTSSFGLGGRLEDISQKQPEPVDDHNASRLLLSHLGMLQLQNLEKHLCTYPYGGLQCLSSNDDMLLESLKALDTLPSRTYDTMYVFFVKKGQIDASEIQSNKIPSLDSHFFTEFLHSLGWEVDMSSHTGWNGDVTTSWKTTTEKTHKTMFYYADLMTEVAIHVPALNLNQLYRPESFCRDETDKCVIEEIPIFELSEKNVSSRKTSESEEKKVVRKQTQLEQTGSVEIKLRSHNCQSETKVVVAWLQDFNDHVNFPVLDLVEMNDPQEHSYLLNHPPSTRVPDKEVVVIYIHPLKTGLFRVSTETVFGSSIGGPLVDGMVVSRRVLGSLVRNTAINIFRRRRLEIDSYSPPHVCRKLKIQDITRRYKKDSDIPEFYASLFKP